jgi:hypothetical protein
MAGAIWWASRARQVPTCERFRTGWLKSPRCSREFVSCIQPAEPSVGRLLVGSWNRSLAGVGEYERAQRVVGDAYR